MEPTVRPGLVRLVAGKQEPGSSRSPPARPVVLTTVTYLSRFEERYTNPDLRSLGAIHLATAEHVVSVTRRPLEAFVAYDEHLLLAALQAGIPAIAPGLS